MVLFLKMKVVDIFQSVLFVNLWMLSDMVIKRIKFKGIFVIPVHVSSVKDFPGDERIMHRLMIGGRKSRFLKGEKPIPNMFFSFNQFIVKMSGNPAFSTQNRLNR